MSTLTLDNNFWHQKRPSWGWGRSSWVEHLPGIHKAVYMHTHECRHRHDTHTTHVCCAHTIHVCLHIHTAHITCRDTQAYTPHTPHAGPPFFSSNDGVFHHVSQPGGGPEGDDEARQEQSGRWLSALRCPAAGRRPDAAQVRLTRRAPTPQEATTCL